MVAFLLGVGLILGGSLLGESLLGGSRLGESLSWEQRPPREEAVHPATAQRRLAWPRTLDALPVWTGADARKATPNGGSVTTRRFDVTFHHLHTKEVLPVEAEALPPADTLAFFLRCRATWEVHPVAPEPVAVGLAMARAHGADRVEIISGFRSPKLNEMLRKKGREVAPSSRHMSGEALDFRVPGMPAEELATSIARTHVGGIGAYPFSNFVHVDVGPPRRWRGR